MPDLNKKQVEFWGVILIICLVVATAILLVDFQIKQAILEESSRLRLRIEEWEVRHSGLRTHKDGATNDPANNGPFPGPVLVDSTTGMETGDVPNGGPKPRKPSTSSRGRRHDTKGTSNGGEIPPGA